MRWAGAACTKAATLAWITARQTGDGAKELGIDVRGPDSAALAEIALAHLQNGTPAPRQARHHRQPRTRRTRHRARSTLLSRPATAFTITW